jgi:hypothetical protein
MKIGAMHSHLNGYEWLLVHQPQIWTEIEQTIESIPASQLRTKKSKEQGMAGKMLYSPKALNQEFCARLGDRGWEESRTTYWVTADYRLIRDTIHLPADEQKRIIEDNDGEAILSYNQTDFVKHRVAIEVQFGKYSFIAYDLFVKHLAFYVGNSIDVGVEILPMILRRRAL